MDIKLVNKILEDIFTPISQSDLKSREAAGKKAKEEAQKKLLKTAWVKTAKEELEKELGIATYIDVNGSNLDDGYIYVGSFFNEKANNGERKWLVFENEYYAKNYAIAEVENYLQETPESFNQEWLKNFIEISDTDKRIIAQEEADNYIDNNDNEYSDEDEKEAARESKYDEIYGALKDPIEYFVNEQGIYTKEDLLKASFITINIEDAAEDSIEQDGIANTIDRYDGVEVELPSGAIAYGAN